MALSPMMQQYFQIKENYQDTILMFRLGDFYEMFFDDAKLASKELELVLTGRDCGQEERAPMCGVPFHSADGYIAKLVSRGYKVAICEQMEDPALAKGIVKRDVIRVITPGTVIESSMLDESKNNYLASVCATNGNVGMCFIDISTGEVNLTEFSENVEQRVINEMGRYNPTEIILNKEVVSFNSLKDFISKKLEASVELLIEEFEFTNAELLCKEHFNTNDLGTLSLNQRDTAVCALGASLAYLKATQKRDLENIKSVNFYTDAKFMNLGISAIRNLELLETMRDRDRKGSLLWVLDKTKTAMGKRMLRSFIERPLYDCAEISKRLNSVDELYGNTELRERETELMIGVYDMERLMTRIVYNTANAKELLSLCTTLENLPELKENLKNANSNMLKYIYNEIDVLADICSLIKVSIKEDAPFSVREGGMIKDAFNKELDELRDIVNGGKSILAKLEADEQEKTGIKKLKIGYNKVFGYYFEVLNSYKELVPDTYIRKQTLSNCERYITQELKELETKVLGAQERIVGLEYEIFNSIRKKIAGEYLRTQRTAHAVALLDVLCSFATVSLKNNYTRPDINDKGVIRIYEGRHPVIESLQKHTMFVPNDTILDCNENRMAVITGPNMAGKSTYMRQIAIITIMAQMGCFVPAKSADIGIVDSIFTRVGASDDLASGQSTFMVEMNEVNNALKFATKNSLILFDEIGRGTATYDGMALAQAIIEYIHENVKCKTMFSTHYHELTVLDKDLSHLFNVHVSAEEVNGDIVFMHKVFKGSASQSYGINVAKLADIPLDIILRAKDILNRLEDSSNKKKVNLSLSNYQAPLLYDSKTEKETIVLKDLKEANIYAMSPIDAMNFLNELQKKLK